MVQSGSVTVTASYAGDANFAANTNTTNTVTQTVRNFSLKALTNPSSPLLTQGSTTANDPFNPSTSAAISTAIAGYTDPLSVSCMVSGFPSGYTSGSLACQATAAPANPPGGFAGFVLSASSSAPIGLYTITVIATDKTVTTLSQSASFTIEVIQKTAQVNVPAATSSPVAVTFMTTNPIPEGSTLSCGNDVYPLNSNGSYGTPLPLAQVGITCSGFAASGTNPPTYSFSLTTGGPTASARLSTTGNVFAAAILGVPLLFLIGLLPGMRTRRRSFLRFLGAIALIAVAMHTVGCGSGGFTRTTPSVAISGSFVLEIESTPSGGGAATTVAAIPVVIGQ